MRLSEPMVAPVSSAAGFALDANGLGELRRAAREHSPEAIRATARQFEAMFINMLLKSMREAGFQADTFNSEQTRMYTSMLDQQLSQSLAAKGVGLADVLARQLASMSGERPAPPADDDTAAPGTKGMRSVVGTAGPAGQPAHVTAFTERLLPHARIASQQTGIPARFMLAQAALETGWGRHEIRSGDGGMSHNLFGIKATGDWKGRVVEAATTEYIGGVPLTRTERFRVYDSYAEAFRDYANLLRSNPRYRDVLEHATDAESFALRLQDAGYATDPNYARKLVRIIRTSLSA